MRYDIYYSGSVGKNDGRLILSLNSNSIEKLIGNGHYFEFESLPKLLGLIVANDKQEEFSINPNQLKPYLGALNGDLATFEEKCGINTHENPRLEGALYASDALHIMTEYSKRVVQDNSSLIVVPDSFNFQNGFRFRQFRGERLGLGGFCIIHSATIEKEDVGQRRYEGEVHWSDLLEGVSATDKFVTYKMPKSVNSSRNSLPIRVRPQRINCLTRGFDFTIQRTFDNELEDYVIEALTKAK